jgi:hypothetical protein
MIIDALIYSLVGFLAFLFSWLPGAGDVPLLLPWGTDHSIVLAVGYFRGIMSTFPYLEVVWICFGYVILFEIGLLLLKFILGSRTPGKEIN